MTAKIRGMNHRLNFGKHKGKTVEWVFLYDPRYLLWAHNTIDWFKVNDEILEKLIEEVFKLNTYHFLEDPSDSPYWFEDDNGSWLS